MFYYPFVVFLASVAVHLCCFQLLFVLLSFPFGEGFCNPVVLHYIQFNIKNTYGRCRAVGSCVGKRLGTTNITDQGSIQHDMGGSQAKRNNLINQLIVRSSHRHLQLHFHVHQSTYISAALSSRFNHVGVIAIEKHPTEKRVRGGERGEREEHRSEPVSVVLFITERNNASEFNSSSAISVIDKPFLCLSTGGLWYYWSICQNNNCNALLQGAVLDRLLRWPDCCIWHMCLGGVEDNVKQKVIQSCERFPPPHTAKLKGHLL